MHIGKTRIISILFLLATGFSLQVSGQLPKDICEGAVPNGWQSHNGTVDISGDRFKQGRQSVKWQWQNNATLTIIDTAFLSVLPNSRQCFVVWVYNEKPLQDSLQFLFGKDEKINCFFSFRLNFKGWRTAWVMYNRDMHGAVERGINRLTIKAPASQSGTFYIDQMMYSININPRSPVPDAQLPFINNSNPLAANAHWTNLYAFSQNPHVLPLSTAVTDKDIKELQSIEKKFTSFLPFTRVSADSIKKEYLRWEIKRIGGKITGNPVLNKNDAELVPGSVNSKNISLPFDVEAYGNLMWDMASAYYQTNDIEYKSLLAGWFINLLEHAEDQGWSSGSAMGALHHLGYSFNPFYNACYIMKRVIQKEGLLQRTWQTMYWYSGLGRTQQKPEDMPPSNIDVLNTLLNGMLATVLMMDDTPEKLRQLKTFSQWFSANLLPDTQINGAFKPDGSIFHHGTLYPAYAIGGLQGLTLVVYILSHTAFSISPEAYQSIRHAMLMMHRFTNPSQWPISLSGRHPTGNFALRPNPFALMAMAGMPGSHTTDTAMASVFLLMQNLPNNASKGISFPFTGIAPSVFPTGHWSMNWGLLSIHRRQNWLLTLRGHNRYFVTHESYPNANVFGRYSTYGHLEILFPVNTNNGGSSFADKGWDWNHIPGTTTLYLPLEKLRADIVNADDYSGVEEMLLSDALFAGGAELDGQGMFAMQLNGHDKYDMGSFRAVKSWFMFDSVVIALGSGIRNKIVDYPTHTTLFQNYNPHGLPLWINGEKTQTAEFSKNYNVAKSLTILDNRNIGYVVTRGNSLQVSTRQQLSRDQKDRNDTKGFFSRAIIDHGKAPENDAYEYVMLINASPKRLQQFALSVLQEKIYRVWQQDSTAHILFYGPLQITAMAIMQPAKKLKDFVVKSVDRPCLLMYKNLENEIRISITDPDLAFYTGADDSPVINGKRKEVSIYSRKWYNAPANPSQVTITLNGKWYSTPAKKNVFELLEQADNTTIVKVSCQNALPVSICLFRR